MTDLVDLTWADEDGLWAREGLFLADDTYKLMYECLRQSIVETSMSAKLLSPPTTRSQQLDSDSRRGRAPATNQVIATSFGEGRHMRNMPREEILCILPKTSINSHPNSITKNHPVHKPSKNF